MIKFNINPPHYVLTFDDAVQVWLRNWQGEYQHHTAAYFRVNQRAINNVLKGHTHPGSEQAAAKIRDREAA